MPPTAAKEAGVCPSFNNHHYKSSSLGFNKPVFARKFPKASTECPGPHCTTSEPRRFRLTAPPLKLAGHWQPAWARPLRRTRPV